MADFRWALFKSAAYLRGKGVTFGSPLVPEEAVNKGVYSIVVGLVKHKGVAALDESLEVFKDHTLDHILVTPMFGAVTDHARLIREFSAKLKVGGHLVCLTNIGETNPGVKKIFPENMEEWVAAGGKWVRKLQYFHPEGRCLQIYKRIEGKRGIIELAPRSTKPRVCVARYGALGDAIVMTPLLRKLHEDGYEVTLNINPYCAPALENNPHIDNLIIQERDVVPNLLLGEYWDHWSKEYDRYINLSESIEGDLLMVEGRQNFFTSKEWRHQIANRNYYDHTMVRGGYPDIKGTRGELFFTRAEERRAEAFMESLRGKFKIVWALNGSSHHKVYPLMEPLLYEWFKSHPDSVVITTGDTMAQLLEFEHPQLIPKASQWSVREAMISTKYADLVIGPETMMTNAAGCYATPKICLLSHSSKENLTKYWENDYSMEPESPCYPCHQLHYTKESCPVGEMHDVSTGHTIGSAPICSMGISPARLMAQMDQIYQQWRPKEMSA